MKKKKSKTFLALLGLGVSALIIGTMAYFYSSYSFDSNVFRTAKYSVTTQELLDENAAQNLTIGQEIPAEISVTNNGEVPIMVRMQFLIDDEPADVRDSANTPGWKFNMASYTEGNYLAYVKELGTLYDIQVIPPKSGETATTCKYLKSITYLGNGQETSDYTTDNSDWNNTSPSEATWGRAEPTTGKTGEKKTYVSNANMNLKVKIETIQATDKNGEEITIPTGASSRTMLAYWNALLKDTTG